MSTVTSPASIYIARQPILSPDQSLFGYALLYRTGSANGLLCDEAHAADHLIQHLTDHFDPTALAAGKKAMLSVSPASVAAGAHLSLDRQQTLFELVAYNDDIQELLDACTRLRADGYVPAVRLADSAANDPRVMNIAAYLTISMKDLSHSDLKAMLGLATRCKTICLAKDVMTEVSFEEAQQLGCQLFQGYYFGRPTMIPHRDVPASKTMYLKLIQKLHQPDITVEELEHIIKRDPGLSVKLLKRINSAGYGVRQKITSIKQAITLLGMKSLRQWVSSMMIVKMASGKSQALLCQCITRAFMCEAIARRCDIDRDDEFAYFLTGLFSLLDVVLDCHRKELLLQVNLPQAVVEALNGEDNHPARCLRLVIAHEEGDWTAISKGYFELGIDVGDLSEIFSQTVQIADAIV